jgi:site-specific DNA recombinase
VVVGTTASTEAPGGHAVCPATGGSILCEVADEQIEDLVEAIELDPKWEEEVLSIISVTDEVESIAEKRRKADERLRRLGRAYVDGVYDDDEYRRQKRKLVLEMESLVAPEADAAGEAGLLIERLPELWSGANEEERRKLLLTMLEAVYVDIKDERRIVAIRPKVPFKPVFQVATTREGTGVVLVHEPEAEPELVAAGQPPPDGHEADADSCSWWRRGRVELPVQKNP